MISHAIDIYCDICGYVRAVCAPGEVRETRAWMRTLGWKYVKVGDGYADLCPDCAAAEEEDKDE